MSVDFDFDFDLAEAELEISAEVLGAEIADWEAGLVLPLGDRRRSRTAKPPRGQSWRQSDYHQQVRTVLSSQGLAGGQNRTQKHYAICEIERVSTSREVDPRSKPEDPRSESTESRQARVIGITAKAKTRKQAKLSCR